MGSWDTYMYRGIMGHLCMVGSWDTYIYCGIMGHLHIRYLDYISFQIFLTSCSHYHWPNMKLLYSIASHLIASHSLRGIEEAAPHTQWLMQILVFLVAMVATGQEIKRSSLHMGHDSYNKSTHQPRLSQAKYSLTVQNYGIKLHWYIDLFTY